MPRIRCHYVDCVYLDDGFCGTSSVEIDPDEGCVTFAIDEVSIDKDWEEDDLEEMWEVEDVDILDDEEEEEEDDDLWLDDDI